MSVSRDFDFCSKTFDPRFALSGASPQFAQDRAFETKHLKLELEVNLDKETLTGTCTVDTHKLHNFDKFQFNAVDMKIKGVKVDGKKAEFKYENDLLLVDNKNANKDEQVVCIEYEVSKPKLGLFFIKPDKDYPKKPMQAWTHSEAQEARYWYPCHDEPETKCTNEITLTVPSGFIGVANGKLEKVEEKDGKKTFYWKMNYPNSTYLNSFAVGKFAEHKEKWGNVDVQFFAEKDKIEDAKRAFSKTSKCLTVFSDKIGVKYPYEKYAQVAVADFIYGGMEHTTCTTQTDSALQDVISRNETPDWPDELMAHELAHQWFGDLLTCRDWSHAWLNESFATYFSAVFTEEDKGKDEFLYQLFQDAQAYFDEDANEHRRAIVTATYKEPSDLFDRHLYQKGCCVLHYLRKTVGDELWWKTINNYVMSNAHKNVETVDLINAFRSTTGYNVNKFFKQWIFSAGHPEFKVNYWWDEKTKKAHVRVIQKQKPDGETPLFELLLTLGFVVKGKNVEQKIKIEKNDHTFEYKFDAKPDLVMFDPNFDLLLKKVDFSKDNSMWQYQLENCENPLARIQAAYNLAKVSTLDNVKVLKSALLKDKHWGVQCEIASALESMETDHALNALIECLEKVKDNRVKSAILSAIGEFHTSTAFDVARKYVDVKDSYVVPMAALAAIGKSQNEKALEVVKKNLDRESFMDEVQAGAIRALTALGTKEAIELLAERTKRGHSERARLSAIRQLPKTSTNKDKVLTTLLDLTKDPYILVQLAAVNSLGDLGDPRAKDRLKEIMEGKHLDSRVKRHAELSIKKIDAGIDAPGVDIEKMKKELEDLRKQKEKKEDKPPIDA